MKAKTINEVQNFERNIDPKKSMKIGFERFTIPPSKIQLKMAQNPGGYRTSPAKKLLMKIGKGSWQILLKFESDDDFSDIISNIIIKQEEEIKKQFSELLEEKERENPRSLPDVWKM